MSNKTQSSKPAHSRPWAGLWPVLLLAPLAMAPKGCEPVVIGDDCPNETTCTVGNAGAPMSGVAGSRPIGSGGSAGSKPTGTGGSAGSPASGTAGSPSTGLCGGLLGLQCAANEYCAFDVKAACGAADQTGVCTRKPALCTEIYAPVCGCDGQTYSSECQAASKGSSVQHTGVCEQLPSGGTCGGLKPASCAKSEYCNFPIDAKCGAADQTGTCTRIPEACDAVYDPVCGCDGATYSSACAAGLKGVSVLHSGTCEGATPGTVCGGLRGVGCAKNEFCDFPIETRCGSGDQTGTCSNIPGACTKELDPVCGCDGNNYGNACAAAAAGISVASKGACGTPSTGCGARLGDTCAADQYCSFTREAICGRADATGICVAKPGGACVTLYDPVCGCDGKTYGNACEAGLAGMSILTDGACP